MLNDKKTLQKYIDTLLQLVEDADVKNILSNYSNIKAEETGYDNWNGGQSFYTVYIEIPIMTFKQFQQKINTLETNITKRLNFLIRDLPYASSTVF